MKSELKFIILLLSLAVTVTAQEYTPGDHELLFMPTAYTMPAGNSYFSDYDLFLLNYSIAVTSTTHVGIFSLFPITTLFYETFTFGVKQNIEFNNSIQSAFYGTYTPKANLYSIGNVVSIGEVKKSFNFSLAYLKDNESSTGEILYMAGVRYDPSEKVSLFLEYENSKELFDNKYMGIFSFGFRIRSTNMSWEIAGIRPTGETGELLLIPFLKVGYYFN